jgi:hypothetical protein
MDTPIFLPFQCKNILPIDHVIITGLAIRGDLGPISVWMTREDLDGSFHMDPNVASNVNRARSMRCIAMKKAQWVQIYSRSHEPSRHSYTNLDLTANPILIYPDRIRGIYIHSELDGDTAIVYDNKRETIKRHDDDFLTIFSGRAHVSTQPFARIPIWGMGNAWRDNREFVGRIQYGVVYKLWSPNIFRQFSGPSFQKMVRTIMTCQKRWPTCPVSRLPDDCIFYILMMCRWDWAGDTQDEIRRHKRILLQSASVQDISTNTQTTPHSDPSDRLGRQESSSNYGDANVLYDGADRDSEDECDDEEDDDDDDDDSEGETNDDESENEDDESDDVSDEDDDGYVDHRGSSSFYFQIFDDLADPSDDKVMADTARSFYENQRRAWLRTQFLQYAAPRGREEEEEEDDDDE